MSSNKPIYRIPTYGNRMNITEYADLIQHKLEIGTLVQPVRLDSCGVGGALVDLLIHRGVKVESFIIFLLK